EVVGNLVAAEQDADALVLQHIVDSRRGPQGVEDHGDIRRLGAETAAQVAEQRSTGLLQLRRPRAPAQQTDLMQQVVAVDQVVHRSAFAERSCSGSFIVYGEGGGGEGKSEPKRREAWPGGHASALLGTARGSAGLG